MLQENNRTPPSGAKKHSFEEGSHPADRCPVGWRRLQHVLFVALWFCRAWELFV